MLSLVFIDFAHTLALTPPTMLGSGQGVSAPQDLQLHSFPLPDIYLYSPLQAQGVPSNTAPWPFHSPPSPPALASCPAPFAQDGGGMEATGAIPQGPRTPPQPAGGQGVEGLTGHSWGRSPVCTRWCFCRWASWVKLFWHRAHWNGRSPLCTRRWT